MITLQRDKFAEGVGIALNEGDTPPLDLSMWSTFHQIEMNKAKAAYENLLCMWHDAKELNGKLTHRYSMAKLAAIIGWGFVALPLLVKLINWAFALLRGGAHALNNLG